MKALSYLVAGLDGAELPCLEAGTRRAPAVLLLHALMGSASSWWREMRWLSQFSRAVAFDQRGHGDSVVPEAPDWSRAAFVADAVAVIRARRLAPAVVIGHSMGAINAICLAAEHPDLVQALVLVDQTPRAPRNQAEWRADVARWPETFGSVAEVHEFFAPHGAYVATSLRRDGDRYRLALPPDRLLAIREPWDERDHWIEYESIKCPTLIVGGGRSFDPDLAAQMVERHPDARYVEIPDAGHFVHYDAPVAFREAVEPFLRSQVA